MGIVGVEPTSALHTSRLQRGGLANAQYSRIISKSPLKIAQKKALGTVSIPKAYQTSRLPSSHIGHVL